MLLLDKSMTVVFEAFIFIRLLHCIRFSYFRPIRHLLHYRAFFITLSSLYYNYCQAIITLSFGIGKAYGIYIFYRLWYW